MGDGQTAIGQRMWGLRVCTCSRTRHREGSALPPFPLSADPAAPPGGISERSRPTPCLAGELCRTSKVGSSPTAALQASEQLSQRQEAEQIEGSDT